MMFGLLPDRAPSSLHNAWHLNYETLVQSNMKTLSRQRFSIYVRLQVAIFQIAGYLSKLLHNPFEGSLVPRGKPD